VEAPASRRVFDRRVAWDGEMSRSKIRLVIGAYFIAAVIFGVFEFFEDHPFSKINIINIEAAIGYGLVPFVGGGLLPLIGWAFVRFRESHAVAPLVLWLLLGAGVAFLSDYGSRYDRNSKIESFGSGNEGFTGKDRDDIYRGARDECYQIQRANPLTKLAIPADKITAYCDCYAEGMASAMTIDEVKVMISSKGKPPASVVDKATRFGNSCDQ
jgi:hypothetical protein